MDAIRAQRITDELKGKKVGAWTVVEKIHYGKSALVFKAKRKGNIAALKIFDPDLVESHGRDKQLERIEREKSLIGVHNPHLVQIKDGGACERTGFLYVVMKYLPYKNLSQKLAEVPRDLIQHVICQVASAAQFLEARGLAHRDIKPENIAISDNFQRAVLLDLGVLRPVGLSDLTDNEQKVFLGTLQYSPPELLYRDEADTVEGWRAVTFYQLGAVLHDLIMKRPIFEQECHPFARLVDAVRQVDPTVDADDVDDDLKLLAKCCLLKDPVARLRFVTWDRFKVASDVPVNTEDIRVRILQRQAVIGVNKSEESLDVAEDNEIKMERLRSIVNTVEKTVREICTSDCDCFPRFEIHTQVSAGEDSELLNLTFAPSRRHGLFHTVRLFIWISVLDVRQSLVYLRFKAFGQASERFQIVEDTGEPENLFKGPFAEGALNRRMKTMLYALIEKALNLESSAGYDYLSPEEEANFHPIRLSLALVED